MACVLVACGGDGDNSKDPVVIPPEATAAETTMKEQLLVFVPHIASFRTALAVIVNPDAGLAPGITLLPDPQPGAPPNSYVFDGIYDYDQDGISETALSGNVSFAGDPASHDWSPMTGTATVDVQIPVIGRLYHAAIAFNVQDTEIRVSGSGTFTEPLGGATTTITVPSSAPLVVKSAPGAGNLVANACAYNVTGSVPVELAGSAGTINATWQFSPNTASVAVQSVSFRDRSNQVTAMPDSSVTLGCRTSGVIDDWVGVYDQTWVCLPLEYGSARLALTTTGANRLSVDDEDPPGSGDRKTYPATLLDASPHAAQGYFDGGTASDVYREHFTWTLGKDGNFTQWSRYEYTAGSNVGASGMCAGVARRAP